MSDPKSAAPAAVKTLKDKEDMTLTEKLLLAAQLVAFFCKIGCFTFGGGWSIVAQIQKEFVENRHWLTEQDLLDMTAVGRSLPGTMIGNVSYLFGYHLGGFICGFAATLGMLIPPVIFLSIITMFYNSFKDNIYVARAMVGVRASVVPIIGSACMKLRKGAYVDKLGYLFTAIALVLCLFFNVNNILIVLAGAAAALILQSQKARKEAN